MGYMYDRAKSNFSLLRIYSLGLSALLVISLLIFMALAQPHYLSPKGSRKIIYSHFDLKYDPPIIIPPAELKAAQEEHKKQTQEPIGKTEPLGEKIIIPKIKLNIPKSVQVGKNGANSQNMPMPSIASNPSAASNPSEGANKLGTRSNNNVLPQLAPATQNTIFMAECEKADPQERPPNCPTNTKVKKMVDINNGPRYRPERVQGHTNSEVNAKYFAGWRERCQTNEGYQAQVCIPFGKKPARVKTPQELCLEQGLSHCNGVPMPRKTETEEKQ